MWLQIDKELIKTGRGVFKARKPLPIAGNIKNQGIINVTNPKIKPSVKLALKIL